MKKIFLVLAFGIAGIRTFAQCPINGTHTDPTPGLSPANGGATPASSDFKQNNFDWTGCINSQTSGGTFNTTTVGQLNSPFWTPTVPIPPFAGACLSDFY